MILVHPIFVKRVYLDIFKKVQQVECAILPLVNANVFTIEHWSHTIFVDLPKGSNPPKQRGEGQKTQAKTLVAHTQKMFFTFLPYIHYCFTFLHPIAISYLVFS